MPTIWAGSERETVIGQRENYVAIVGTSVLVYLGLHERVIRATNTEAGMVACRPVYVAGDVPCPALVAALGELSRRESWAIVGFTTCHDASSS